MLVAWYRDVVSMHRNGNLGLGGLGLDFGCRDEEGLGWSSGILGKGVGAGDHHSGMFWMSFK